MCAAPRPGDDIALRPGDVTVGARSGESVVTRIRRSGGGCRRVAGGEATGDAVTLDDAPSTMAASDKSTPPSTAPVNVDVFD